ERRETGEADDPAPDPDTDLLPTRSLPCAAPSGAVPESQVSPPRAARRSRRPARRWLAGRPPARPPPWLGRPARRGDRTPGEATLANRRQAPGARRQARTVRNLAPGAWRLALHRPDRREGR